MAQIFHPSANTLSKATIFGTVFVIAGLVAIGYVLVRSPYFTGVNIPVEQPVPEIRPRQVDRGHVRPPAEERPERPHLGRSAEDDDGAVAEVQPVGVVDDRRNRLVRRRFEDAPVQPVVQTGPQP